MIKFRDVLFETLWIDVEESLLDLYPDPSENIEGYRQVYEELNSLEPSDNEDNCTIVIELQYDDIEKKNYYSVSGLIDGMTYGIEFSPWEEWLGYYVDENLLKEMSKEEIVAHCLYEMTWAGFTQKDIKERVDEIEQVIQDYKNGKIEAVDIDDLDLTN